MTNLSVNDTVVVYPCCGQLSPDGRSWRIDVCGTVYEEGSISRRKHILARLMQRAAKVQPSEAERELFEQRVRAFIAPTERGKRVAVRVGGSIFPIRRKTQRSGRFFGTVRLPLSAVHKEMSGTLGQNGWLEMQVVAPDGMDRFRGRAQLLHPTGTSIISDIDDTLKITDVHCRQSLIANTFLREFRAVDGMAARYRQWSEAGATFHYVSSSPWQLFSPLTELFDEANYPAGTFHLRSFRLREHMMRRLLLIRRRGKVTAIRSLLERFPNRSFVMVGDSGEKDPEIYANLARRFPDQVRLIFIRQLARRPMDIERQRRVFRHLAPGSWTLFDSADQLPSELPAELPAQLSARLPDRLPA